MDEDDDFFDMRARFKLPEKRAKRSLGADQSSGSGSSSSSSDDSDSDVEIPDRPRHLATRKPVAPKRKSNVISVDTDSDSEEETPQITPVASRKRPRSLTPPPILGEAAIQQAMAVVTDHMNHKRTRQRSYATGSPPPEPTANNIADDASSDFNDDFDMAAYQSKLLNSDIAKQAAKLKQSEQTTTKTEQPQKILLVLLGRREGDTGLPEGWEKPLGLNVFSTISLSKMRTEFQRNRKYDKDVILAWKGVRLRHGTPKDIGMTNQSRIDVYSEKSWKYYEDQRRRSEQKANRKEEDVVSLSSEDQETAPAPPKTLALTLQGPGQKVKLRVAETASIRTIASVYRKVAKIPADKKITISLDGDTLLETATVKTLDVDDDDVLDVQI